jgi:hypothetical protein
VGFLEEYLKCFCPSGIKREGYVCIINVCQNFQTATFVLNMRYIDNELINNYFKFQQKTSMKPLINYHKMPKFKQTTRYIDLISDSGSRKPKIINGIYKTTLTERNKACNSLDQVFDEHSVFGSDIATCGDVEEDLTIDDHFTSDFQPNSLDYKDVNTEYQEESFEYAFDNEPNYHAITIVTDDTDAVFVNNSRETVGPKVYEHRDQNDNKYLSIEKRIRRLTSTDIDGDVRLAKSYDLDVCELKGKVSEIKHRIKSTDRLNVEKGEVICEKERPRKKSVSEKIALFEVRNKRNFSYQYQVTIHIIIIPYPTKWGRHNMFSSSILFYHSSSCSLLLFSCHPSHNPSIFS